MLTVLIEIKMMVFSVLSNVKVELVGNKYKIIDKLMIASAPPEAYFKFTKRVAWPISPAHVEGEAL